MDGIRTTLCGSAGSIHRIIVDAGDAGAQWFSPDGGMGSPRWEGFQILPVS